MKVRQLMKVYNILTTIVVEDRVDESEIQNLRSDIQTAVIENFYISNCINHYELKETIDYPDTPPRENDPEGEAYDKWIEKSQEVIDRILIEMRNP